ncbi:hypothetical protein CEXT_526841 [Caerostris extrusa]|uniref:Uncharacterized protein n=1 Tax=Caerostris extrusa TaxID=172846 RepID=A0AAV4TX88_CAEEX|nr:hypothetical protein CEXT_526841 [Caerostris extrusa]
MSLKVSSSYKHFKAVFKDSKSGKVCRCFESMLDPFRPYLFLCLMEKDVCSSQLDLKLAQHRFRIHILRRAHHLVTWCLSWTSVCLWSRIA